MRVERKHYNTHASMYLAFTLQALTSTCLISTNTILSLNWSIMFLGQNIEQKRTEPPETKRILIFMCLLFNNPWQSIWICFT